MPHICVSELGENWFWEWLVALSAPSHYLNQCWLIINCTLRNKLHWNFNQNTKFSIHENASKYIVCKVAAILSGGDGFMVIHAVKWAGQAVVVSCSHVGDGPSLAYLKHISLRSISLRISDTHRHISNISHTLVGNKIVYHSDVVGASPVGAAPTTSSFST